MPEKSATVPVKRPYLSAHLLAVTSQKTSSPKWEVDYARNA
jgi:hypothetical protein